MSSLFPKKISGRAGLGGARPADNAKLNSTTRRSAGGKGNGTPVNSNGSIWQRLHRVQIAARNFIVRNDARMILLRIELDPGIHEYYCPGLDMNYIISADRKIPTPNSTP